MKTLSDQYISLTTDAAGDVTVADVSLKGMLYAIEWVDGDLADGVDAVISCINTGSLVDQTLLTLTNANDDAWYFPRIESHNLAGANNGGLEYPVLNGTIQIVVSSGGNAATGGVNIWYWKP